MRPYLAIIKDSFREALASRVLWVLLLMITALMIALIPFHWLSTIAAGVDDQDIRSIRTMANTLKVGANDDAPELAKYLWNSLSEKTQERVAGLTDAVGPNAFRTRERLARDINRIIEKPDFYDEQIWGETKLGKRAEELLEKKPLEGDHLKQFNRLAFEAAIPGQLRPCPDEAVMFRYAKWDLDFVPSLRRKDAVSIIDKFMITFMGIFVGFFGIFAGVLVTAPIIPNMLNSGSLYVLLSKPIARPTLFISKFLGGCSFVTINASYLIVGLWLILGLRFGIWKPQLLWSIPLFLFSFAIFYSVSALSGLVWRSAIMAIVATIVFWFLCAMVGTSRGFLEQFVMVPGQINKVLLQDDDLFITRSNGEVAKWDPTTNELAEIFENQTPSNRRGPEMMMGPSSTIASMTYDPASKQLVALDRKWSQSNFITGSTENGFRRDKTVLAPRNARAMFEHNGQLVVVADGGVYPVQLNAEQVVEKKGSSIFGLINIPAIPTKKEPVAKLSGDLGTLPGDARIAYDASIGAIYIHGARSIRRLSQQEGLFQQVKNIEQDVPQVTHLTAGGGVVAIAYVEKDATAKLRLLDSELTMTSEIETNSEVDVRELELSTDGKLLACLFDNDELRIYDAAHGNKQLRSLPKHKSIADVSFGTDAIVVATINDRVDRYSLPDFKRLQTVNPRLPFIKQAYKYFLNPLYLIFPKPSELQNTMQYVITGQETMKIEGPGMGAGGRTVKLNPWQPLLSNSLFIGVMLLIGCFYVFRQDF